MRRRLALAGAAGITAALATWTPPKTEVRLLFTGDIMMSRQVEVELDRRRVDPWAGFAELFSGADWVGGNFEGSVGQPADCTTHPPAICFATPVSAATRLARAGFDAVTVENNHSGDLGVSGRNATREAFRRTGVMATNFDQSPQFIRVGSRTIALIAVNTIAGSDGPAQRVPSVALEQKLRLAKTLANLVVVSVHWGPELYDWPGEQQRRDASWLVDHGADLILGHHPHVVQEPECIHGRPVFFSLGNHLFDQKYPATKLGLIADCRIVSGRLSCTGIRTRTRQGSAIPEPTGVDSLPLLRRCAIPVADGARFGDAIIKPAPWSPSDSGPGFSLESWRDDRRDWTTRRTNVRSLQFGLADTAGAPLLFSLEEHPSPLDGETTIRPYVYAAGPHGLVARWRGSALAWPLIDAVVMPDGTLCALHRGDAFIARDSTSRKTRTMRYRWNGFGFSAATPSVCNAW